MAGEEYLPEDFELKSQFMKLDNKRTDTLERCERYAGYTLPNVFPDEELQESDEMQHDYQSVGAQAVTNLANKIMLALFQPTRPFFKLNLTSKQKEEVLTSGMKEAEIDVLLSTAERNSMRELDKRNARVVLTDAIINLIIVGNTLLYTPNDKMQNYFLRDYVIERNLSSDFTRIITRDSKEVTGLDDDLVTLCMNNGYGESDVVTIYTCIKKVAENKYVVWQELEDLAYCHKRIGIYKKADLPWIPLTWNLSRGKNYGTGLVENYAGDFHTLSTLAEGILDYTTLVTDVKNLVNPAGMTDVRVISEAQSGAYVPGREEDIFVHTPNVSNNADFLTNQFEAVSRRIGAAFLMNVAVTRNAERVTAEEIRMQAHELERSLGGVYSRLAAELQLPLATKLVKSIDPIFADIEPIIVTGLESLSRNSDLDQLRYFFQDLIGLSDVPEQVAARIDYNNLIAVLGAGHGVEYNKFLKSENQVNKDREEAIKANANAAGQEAQAVEAAKGQQ